MNRGSIEPMSIDIPSINTLLEFVPTAHYGDTIPDNAACDVPQPFTPASRASRGGARHLSSILPAVSAAIGAPVTTAVHHDPVLLQHTLGFPDAKSAIVVLVDGLGYWNLAQHVAYTQYLRTLMKDSANQRPISTCAPSTTTAALATFGTGTCPGLTSMTGYTQKNPDTGELAQLIQFRNAPSPEFLQQEPTVFTRLAEHDVRVTSVGLNKFMFSALTRAALRGAHYVGAQTPMTHVQQAAHSAQTPGLTYLYLRDIDKNGHADGPQSESWLTALETVDNQLATLRRLAPQGTLLVIVADHGMVEADPASRIDIAQEPELMEGVALIGGEPRSVMVYAEHADDVQAIAQRWQHRLDGLAWIRTKQEAIASGLFGPVNERTQAVLGDLIVQAANRVTIVDSRTQTDMATRLPGVHGSQTMLEMDIPCLIDVVD